MSRWTHERRFWFRHYGSVAMEAEVREVTRRLHEMPPASFEQVVGYQPLQLGWPLRGFLKVSLIFFAVAVAIVAFDWDGLNGKRSGGWIIVGFFAVPGALALLGGLLGVELWVTEAGFELRRLFSVLHRIPFSADLTLLVEIKRDEIGNSAAPHYNVYLFVPRGNMRPGYLLPSINAPQLIQLARLFPEERREVHNLYSNQAGIDRDRRRQKLARRRRGPPGGAGDRPGRAS